MGFEVAGEGLERGLDAGLVAPRTGRAEAHFLPDPSLLVQLAGTRVDWSGVIFDPQGSTALAPAGFDVLP